MEQKRNYRIPLITTSFFAQCHQNSTSYRRFIRSIIIRWISKNYITTIAQHKRRETERQSEKRKERKERKGKRKEKQENRWHVFRRKKKKGIHTKKSPPEVFTSGGLTENGGDLLSHLYAVPSAR